MVPHEMNDYSAKSVPHLLCIEFLEVPLAGWRFDLFPLLIVFSDDWLTGMWQDDKGIWGEYATFHRYSIKHLTRQPNNNPNSKSSQTNTNLTLYKHENNKFQALKQPSYNNCTF